MSIFMYKGANYLRDMTIKGNFMIGDTVLRCTISPNFQETSLLIFFIPSRQKGSHY